MRPIPRHGWFYSLRTPRRGSAGHLALSVLVGRGKPIHDTIVLSSPNDLLTLRSYARGQGERPTL